MDAGLRETGWHLTSSSGQARVACTRPSADPPGAPFRVRLDYRLAGAEQSSAITDLANVTLNWPAVADLSSAISSFVARPLAEIDSSGFVHVAQLADAADESVRLSFGERPDLVTGSIGIGCLAEIARSFFHAQMVFRTDLTCLERLGEHLDALLLLAPRGPD
jgi:hypothetical protein